MEEIRSQFCSSFVHGIYHLSFAMPSFAEALWWHTADTSEYIRLILWCDYEVSYDAHWNIVGHLRKDGFVHFPRKHPDEDMFTLMLKLRPGNMWQYSLWHLDAPTNSEYGIV